MKTEPKAVETN